ncbi:hypothetical protein EDC61_11490 [Sulfuritortus calidifontis]|uniref:Uncharacterized protein n=1 Tax=Sulfuritortus calidifontis TaxID=1914471 RepID=A0A4R3JWN8_9PROT|nr:hypothetical protein [Sulfuritortus calidifontis]TCS70763.1 hypothetical protein EDC61_11490 [Sulfuritortus calidifontis]
MTPQRVRELTGWPLEVPDALLNAHLAAASRAVDALTPARSGADYEDAIAWEAAATSAPMLHTFALSGAGKVGRLEGTVEWRFLSPEEAAAFADRCRAMRNAALVRLNGTSLVAVGLMLYAI